MRHSPWASAAGPPSVGAINSVGSTKLTGCLPATVGFLLCQGEIVSINIIIYWELLGPPRVFLFFPVRTSLVRTSHPCVILSFTSSVQAAESSVRKIPREHTGWRQLLLQETAEDRDGKRHVVTRRVGWENSS